MSSWLKEFFGEHGAILLAVLAIATFVATAPACSFGSDDDKPSQNTSPNLAWSSWGVYSFSSMCQEWDRYAITSNSSFQIRGGNWTGDSSLHVDHLDTQGNVTSSTKLSDGNAWGGYSNGHHVVWVQEDSDGGYALKSALLDGSQQRTLYAGRLSSHQWLEAIDPLLALSPDGEKVLFLTGLVTTRPWLRGAGSWFIYEMPLDGGTANLLLSNENGSAFIRPVLARYNSESKPVIEFETQALWDLSPKGYFRDQRDDAPRPHFILQEAGWTQTYGC